MSKTEPIGKSHLLCQTRVPAFNVWRSYGGLVWLFAMLVQYNMSTTPLERFFGQGKFSFFRGVTRNGAAA